MTEIYLAIVIGLLVIDYVFSLVVDWLNIRHIRTDIPDEFKDWYDQEKYSKSQQYLKENTRFDLFTSTLLTPLYILFILAGGFRWVDDLARAGGYGLIVTGLIFGGILMLASQVIHLPFSIYETFVIEGKYGFNKTTVKTFILDLVKGLLLTILLGGLVFSGVIWVFAHAGPLAWLYSWLALTVFQIIIIYVAPIWIMPLFNKFTPLEDGDLKESISNYARDQGFALKGIFTMDGSRRSTKTNAYFTGFGRWRRIVLFDTLIEKHGVDELVSVLAHEIGHYKLKHIRKQLVTSALSSGLMFYILSLFITRPGLYAAFQLDMEPVGGSPPIYAGLLFFGFLYAPISMILSLYQNITSRKHEFQADRFAADTAGKPKAMVDALKRLTVDNLSNLSPHFLKVFLEYSHPPVLDRIRAIRGLGRNS